MANISLAGTTPTKVAIPIDKLDTIEAKLVNIRVKLKPILREVNTVSVNDVTKGDGSMPSEINRRLDQIILQIEDIDILIDL